MIFLDGGLEEGSPFDAENLLREKGFTRICGIDEAGRGALAGPVIVGGVMISERIEGITDSKKLTSKRRESLFYQIQMHCISYCVGISWPDEIDKVNILNATKNAAVRLVAMLSPSPQVLLLDALKLPIADIEQHSFIKGDLRIYCIGAASIIAKVVRDRLMIILGEKYPQYGFAKHKGYGTKEHLAAIKEFGPSAIHRWSFEPMRSMGEDNLFS